MPPASHTTTTQEPSRRLAREVETRVRGSQALTSGDLFALAADAYGGTLAEGRLHAPRRIRRRRARLAPPPAPHRRPPPARALRRPRRARRGRAALNAPAQPDAPDGGAERLPAVLDARRLRGALRVGERGGGGDARPRALGRDRRALHVRAGLWRERPRQRAGEPPGRPASGPPGRGGTGPIPDAHARERRPPRRHPPARGPRRRCAHEPARYCWRSRSSRQRGKPGGPRPGHRPTRQPRGRPVGAERGRRRDVAQVRLGEPPVPRPS